MKKILCVVSAIAVTAMLGGCGKTESSADEQDISKAVSEATSEVLDDTTEKVENANYKAVSLRQDISGWLTDCDTQGVLYKDKSLTNVAITVTDGVWRVTLSDINAFSVRGDTNKSIVLLNGAEDGTRAGNHVETNNITEQLEIALANSNTDLDNAYIYASIYDCSCCSLYFVDGTTEQIQELTDNIGDQAEWIDSTYPWSGDVQGTLADGTVVGTSPVI